MKSNLRAGFLGPAQSCGSLIRVIVSVIDNFVSINQAHRNKGNIGLHDFNHYANTNLPNIRKNYREFSQKYFKGAITFKYSIVTVQYIGHPVFSESFLNRNGVKHH